jgi:phage-related protein
VEVVADLRGFAKELRAKVNAAAAGLKDVTVGADVDAKQLRAKLRAAVEEAKKGLGAQDVPFKVPDPGTRPKKNTDELRAALVSLRSEVDKGGDAAMRLEVAQRRLAEAERTGGRESLTYRQAVLAVDKAERNRAAVIDKSREALKNLQAEYKRRGDPTVNIRADVREAEAAIALVARDRTAEIKVDLDRSAASRAEAELQKFAGRIGEKVSQVGAGIASMFKPSLFAGLISFGLPAVEALGAGLFAVVGAASQALGVIALLPAGIVAAGLGVATLVVGFQGLGAAMSAVAKGDAAKLSKAVEGMTPAARSVVTTMVKLKPLFSTLRKAVQETLLKGIGGDLLTLGRTNVPSLQRALVVSASATNSAFRQTFAFLNRKDTAAGIATGLTTSARAAGVLASTMRPVASIFTSLFVTGAPFILRASNYVAGLARHFAAFMSGAQKSGALTSFLERSVATFTQLGRIVRNLTGGIVGLFRGGMSTGQGLLDTIEKVLARFNEWANSVDGQQRIRAFFESMRNVMRSVGEVITFIAAKIAALQRAFDALPPGVQDFIVKAGALLVILSPLFAVVGKVTTAIGFLVPFISAAATAFGGAFTAALAGGTSGLGAVGAGLAAVLGPVGLVVAAVLAVVAVFAAMYASSAKLREAVSTAFNTVKSIITDAINTVKPLFTSLVAIWNNAVKPSLEKIGDVLASKIAPAFRALKSAYESSVKPALENLVQMFEKNRPAIESFIRGFGNVIAFILKLLPIGTVLSVAFHVIGFAIAVVINFIAELIGVVGLVIGLFQGIPGVLGAVGSFFANLWRSIVDGVTGALSAVGSFFSGLGSSIASGVSAAWSAITSAFSTGVSAITGFFTGLGSSLLAVAASIWSGITGFFGQMWANITFLFSGSISDIVSRFVQMPFDMLAAILNLAASVITLFVNMFVAVGTAVANGWNAVVAYAMALPARIGAAIAGLYTAVTGWITRTWIAASVAFYLGIMSVLAYAMALPGRIGAAIAGLYTAVTGWISRTWTAGRAAFNRGVQAVVVFAMGLPGRIGSAIAGLYSAVTGAISRAWNAGRAAFTSGAAAVINFARGIPGRIADNLRAAVSMLTNIGGQIIAGLANGLRAGVGKVMEAARNLAKAIPLPIRKFLGLASPSRLMLQFGQWVAQGLAIGITSKTADVIKAASNLAKGLLSAVTAKGKSRVRGATTGLLALINRENASLVRVGEARKKIVDKLAAAEKGYADVLKQSAEYAGKVAESARGFASILSVSSEGARSPEAILRNLRDRLAKVKEFAATITRLKSLNLNSTALDQIIQAGVDGGGDVARALVAGGQAAVTQANALQVEINAAAIGLGNSAASTMYDAGIKAAAGLVAGLRQQEKAIAAQMARIANLMAAQIRKALKIRSPSMVMRVVGRFTGMGYEQGLADRIPAVLRLAQQVAAAAASASGRMSAGSGGRYSVRPYPSPASTAGGATTINVAPTPGMDVFALAAAIDHQLEWSRG